MLPYFKFTEDVETFCNLMGFTIDGVTLDTYACMYGMQFKNTPYITTYNLGLEFSPLIPPEKVIDYLTLMLNNYSCEDAIKEIGVVGDGRSVSS